MKSITFEEHYVIEDIQKETMNAISADPKGVPMKVMLEGLEKKTGFTNADELSHHDERIQFMNNQAFKFKSYLMEMVLLQFGWSESH
ncbi:hypothetical protein ACVNPZ_03980 [Staphylococcus aureus]